MSKHQVRHLGSNIPNYKTVPVFTGLINNHMPPWSYSIFALGQDSSVASSPGLKAWLSWKKGGSDHFHKHFNYIIF